jgi:hypothetical protein
VVAATRSSTLHITWSSFWGRKASRLARSSQPGKVNFAWGVRLKRGAFGGQAGCNLRKTFNWSNTVNPLENRRTGGTDEACTGFRIKSQLRNTYETVADRVDDEFGCLMDTESLHDVGAVNRHGIGAELQVVGDFLVRLAIHDQL